MLISWSSPSFIVLGMLNIVFFYLLPCFVLSFQGAQLGSVESQPLYGSMGCCFETCEEPMGKQLTVRSTRCPCRLPAWQHFLQAFTSPQEWTVGAVDCAVPSSACRLILGRYVLISRSPGLESSPCMSSTRSTESRLNCCLICSSPSLMKSLSGRAIFCICSPY